MNFNKIIYHSLIKLLIFIAAMALVISGLMLTIHTVDKLEYKEAIIEKNYLDSSQFKATLSSDIATLRSLVKYYKSEDYIKNGGTVSDDIIFNRSDLYRLYNDFMEELLNADPDKYYEMSKTARLNLFKARYSKEIEEHKQLKIEEDLALYNKKLNELNTKKGLFYYMESGGVKLTNTSETLKNYFKSKPVYLLFDKGEIENSLKLKERDIYMYNDSFIYSNNDIMYFALDEEFLNPKKAQWDIDRAYLVSKAKIIGILFIGFLLSIIYLFAVAGRRDTDDKIHLTFLDKLFLDVHVLTIYWIIQEIISKLSWMDMSYNFDFYLAIPLLAIGIALILNLLLTIAKHIKNKSVFRHNSIYSLFSKTFSLLKKIFSSAPVAIKMFPTPNRAYNLKNIIKGTKRIKSGDLSYVIETNGSGIFAKLASDINNINEGLKASINNELKSERLKTELITNVSHDIRTPLTSIITYVDLLKKEAPDSENTKKYLKILEKKSLRLKNLTDDLFEASKASSGNIPANFEKIDVIALLVQGVGELEDKIEDSGLQLRFNYPKDKILIRADGKLLWRVIENLMSNTFKYSLPNSRVYIEVRENKHNVDIIVKNISAYELNVESSELVKRFTRNDESRTSEGSGLGLNIAKSLVQLQNGEFVVEIDGDLFKVTVTMPKWQ